MKSFNYYPLIGGQSIFDMKWHHNPHKSPPSLSQRWLYVSLWVQLIFDDILKTCLKRYNYVPNYVDDLVYEREQVNVLFCYYIEFPKINTNRQLPIFLKNNHYWRQSGYSFNLSIKLITSNLSIFYLTIVA
jgi:hypothetical protein